MKKIITLVIGLLFSFGVYAENNNSSVEIEISKKNVITKLAPAIICTTLIGVDCNGDGVYEYMAVVDCENADAGIEQFLASC